MQKEDEAEERAVKAFDAQLPSFVEEIVSSASSSSSDEREIDTAPPQEEEEDVFASLIGQITDITSQIQMETQRNSYDGHGVGSPMQLETRILERHRNK